MRFLVRLVNAYKDPAVVPLDYRRRFISFLKKVLGEEVFSNMETKPYTFAVFFGKGSKVNNGHIEGVPLINFRFSTGDTLVAVRFYNGVLRMKKKGELHPIGSGKFKVEFIKQVEMKNPKGIFKALSPVVVERMGFENERDRYILPFEEGFIESLLENTLRRYTTIYGKEPEFRSFHFEPISVKETKIKHYGGILRGFLGKFKVVSDSEEILRFIYNYGLGLRTGQGFGYVEVEDGRT